MNQPGRTASRVVTIAIVVVGVTALVARRCGDLRAEAVRKPPKHALPRHAHRRAELGCFATRPQPASVGQKTVGKHRKPRNRTAT